MWNCGRCNDMLKWENDYEYQDVGILDKEGIATLYTCMRCDISVEVFIDDDRNDLDDEEE
tara:strand:- start:5123 stop:5302 length:180 start_codon:yes stop_codon:yes gene_type:complete